MKRIILSAIFSILFYSIAVADGAYRWKDEDGVINYGNNPPANAKDVTPVSEMGFSRYSGSTALERYKPFLTTKEDGLEKGPVESVEEDKSAEEEKELPMEEKNDQATTNP